MAATGHPLAEPVRSRVVALAADALGLMPVEHVPGPLRRVASFAPMRRARLAAVPLLAALDSDERFRERIAVHVRTLVPRLAEQVGSGEPPADADPVTVAALAYLVRPPQWESLVAADAASAPGDGARAGEDAAAIARLSGQLDKAGQDARFARSRHRQQLAAAREEVEELRRRLARERRQTRAARERAEQVEAVARREADEAKARLAAAEAEARRLRGRVLELAADVEAGRRTGRKHRELHSVRARLLLDTLLDAARGLRQELALPAVAGTPADHVPAVRPEGGVGRRMGGLDRGLLEEVLALPRAHLVIDGYNVTMSGWDSASLQTQRSRLLAELGPLAARSGAEVTVVFDGAELTAPPPVAEPRGVRVLFSPPGVSADDVVADVVAAEPPGRPVVVASSDREVAAAAEAAGARTVSAAVLLGRLSRG